MNSVNIQDRKLIYRNLLHFYTLNSELSEREIKETVLFTIASKKDIIPRNKSTSGDNRPILGKLRDR